MSRAVEEVQLLNSSSTLWETVAPCSMKSTTNMIDLILVYSGLAFPVTEFGELRCLVFGSLGFGSLVWPTPPAA